MNERAQQFFLNQAIAYCRSTAPGRLIVGREIRAGRICYSCKTPLPEPHTPGRKQCASCVNKQHVYMWFFHCAGWHCHFIAAGRKPLPKRVIFKDEGKIYETARRSGVTDNSALEDLDLAIALGRGGIWLRLSDEQFRALGGVP